MTLVCFIILFGTLIIESLQIASAKNRPHTETDTERQMRLLRGMDWDKFVIDGGRRHYNEAMKYLEETTADTVKIDSTEYTIEEAKAFIQEKMEKMRISVFHEDKK